MNKKVIAIAGAYLLFSLLGGLLHPLACTIVGLFFLAFVQKPWLVVLALTMSAYSYLSLSHGMFESRQLPYELVGQTRVARGVILSIPGYSRHHHHFLYKTDELCDDNMCVAWQGKLHVNWYGKYRALKVGQIWRLQLRFPHQHHSLYDKPYDGVAYVVSGEYISISYSYRLYLNKFREKISAAIKGAMSGDRFQGIVTALALGERDGITRQQWLLLKTTGTGHLVAISGLHVGLVAAFAYFLVGFVGRRFSSFTLVYPTPKLQALAAILGAVAYAALAGFSIPTQRALIMIFLLMVSQVVLRPVSSFYTIAWAFVCVFILQPNQLLTKGCLLSFSAVALILYINTGRLRTQPGITRWLRVQWAIAFGLAPLTMLFFDQIPLLGCFANLIAIPWVGFIVVPCCLLGVVFFSLWPWLGTALWKLAGLNLHYLWYYLTWLESFQGTYQHHVNSVWECLFLSIGVLLVLAPRGFPSRWLGLVWMLPLIV